MTNNLSSLATREIMWNIPSWYGYVMYVLFIIAVIVFIVGMQKKLKFIIGSAGLKALIPSNLNIGNFLKSTFLQRKLARNMTAGFFHGLIFFSFWILIVATTLVGIHYDTPLKIFDGTIYKITSFLADFAGLAVLLGVLIAFFRRYIQKPKHLEASRPWREITMYLFLINFIVIGFLLEGLRIYGTDLPKFEAIWSPLGNLIAICFSFISLSSSLTSVIHEILWIEHMITTMIFIAILPYTKFIHFLFGPYNALITKDKQGAVLRPMDFENEDAETFGLGIVDELTFKNKVDTIACVECGRCTEVCPANASGRILDPKKIITKIRDFTEENKYAGNVNFWEPSQLFEFNELDACTTCGACMEECPQSIEHVQLIQEARRYKVLTLGEIPPMAADATNKVKVNGNPWGIAQHDRFDWAKDLDLPIIEAGKKVDYLYFVGCAGAYDSDNQKVVKDTLALLKKADVSFAVLGEKEKCCGDPVRRFGDEYSFYEIAIENIETFKQYSFNKIVTHCPHCMHTIGKEYSKFDLESFEVIHHTQLLSELIDIGKLTPIKEVKQELTFHDPCYIGRHNGTYDSPRKILNSIKGIKIKEMDKIKDKANCCGMGGGNMWYELPEGEHVSLNRLREIGDTNVNKLATACTYCLINFNSSKGQIEKTENIEIEDVASILAKSIL